MKGKEEEGKKKEIEYLKETAFSQNKGEKTPNGVFVFKFFTHTSVHLW